MNKVIKQTILENGHIFILAAITSIFFISCIYFENMYQNIFYEYYTIYSHDSWSSQVTFYSTMTATTFCCGVGSCIPLGYFLAHDIIMPMIKGD